MPDVPTCFCTHAKQIHALPGSRLLEHTNAPVNACTANGCQCDTYTERPTR